MTLLEIVQQAAAEIGIAVPQIVVGSTDTQVRSLLAVAKRESADLSNRFRWQRLTLEGTFTTVAAELQGDVTTLFPGYKALVNGSMWDRTLDRPIPGALSSQDWQLLKAANTSGPYQSFRIRGNELLFIPAPPAGQTVAAEYYSRFPVLATDGTTAKATWTVDTDTSLLPDALITMGVVWRFKRARGMDYAEEFSSYERSVMDYIGRDGGKSTLYSADPLNGRLPSAYVPEGSWNL
ncbi:hypothetical protein JN531_001350 [Flagellatimonas centrodinii]|uniref:phage adaptor protein n=1 Tax=Flagellatimonas centrodinii TaxID=2806210 RepID=UPI001FF02679|nr:hypothetical protein [Flagellatimonas centrodinii]ULQ46944.1 hypothetical protein JN531_001350 [Flagellatimonas centrodinii]